MILRLATHARLIYAPHFAADALGFFADRGLNVAFLTTGGDRTEAVVSGEADVLVGNLWIAAHALQYGGPKLRPIGLCNSECRYLVVKRRHDSPRPDWNAGAGAVILVPSNGPIPWVAVRAALRRSAPKGAEHRVITGYDAEQCVREFKRGLGDYLVIDVELAQDASLVEVAALADHLGSIPWSVYLTLEEVRSRKRPELEAFDEGVTAAKNWLAVHSTTEVATVMAERFSHLSDDERVSILDRYSRLGIWSAPYRLPAQLVRRWIEILTDEGLVRSSIDFGALG